MADYAVAVVKAVNLMLQRRNVSCKGADAASRKGPDQTLSGRVEGLRAWLHDKHGGTGLHTWSDVEKIGLPKYSPEWGKPAVGRDNWSPEWRSFHEHWVSSVMDAARETKRAKRTVPVSGASTTTVASPAAIAASDEQAGEEPDEATTGISAEELLGIEDGELDAAAALLQVAQEEEQREVLAIAGFELPIDVARLFLDFLPVSALIMCERACKAWHVAISTDVARWERLLLQLSPAALALPTYNGNDARSLCLKLLPMEQPHHRKPQRSWDDFQVSVVVRTGGEPALKGGSTVAADPTTKVQGKVLLEMGEAKRVKYFSDAAGDALVWQQPTAGQTGFEWDGIEMTLLDEYAPTTAAELEAAIDALLTASGLRSSWPCPPGKPWPHTPRGSRQPKPTTLFIMLRRKSDGKIVQCTRGMQLWSSDSDSEAQRARQAAGGRPGLYFRPVELPMVVDPHELWGPTPQMTYPRVDLKVALFPHVNVGGGLRWSIALEFADCHDSKFHFNGEGPHPAAGDDPDADEFREPIDKGHVFFAHGENLLAKLKREDWDDLDWHVVQEALEVASWN